MVFAATKSSGGGIGLIFPLLLVAMVGFLFLNSRKRKAAAANLQTGLRIGSSVMTTAGLYATVVAVGDDGVTLEVSPGVYCKYARQAIARVLDAPDGAEPLDDHEALGDHSDPSDPSDHDDHGDNGPPSIDLNK